jgi:hypothetical protein
VLGGAGHLLREFARRRQHQHARAAAGQRRGLVEAVQAGQHEGRRLAAAGLRGDEQVIAGQRGGDRLRLDGGGFGVAAGLDGLDD